MRTLIDLPWTKLENLRERGWTEWKLLVSAASLLKEESKTRVSRVNMDDPSGLHRQVQVQVQVQRFSSVGID